MCYTYLKFIHFYPDTSTTPPVQAPIRIEGGRNQYEGRVEVFYNGMWGTICDDNWDLDDARYTCNIIHMYI